MKCRLKERNNSDLSHLHKEFDVFDIVLSEVVRQVYVNCVERGCLLEKVRKRMSQLWGALRNGYDELYTMYQEAQDELEDRDEKIQDLEDRVDDLEKEKEWLRKELTQQVARCQQIQRDLEAEKERQKQEKLEAMARKRARAVQCSEEDFVRILEGKQLSSSQFYVSVFFPGGGGGRTLKADTI